MSSPPSAMSNYGIKQQNHRLGIGRMQILGVLAAHFVVFTSLAVLGILTVSYNGFAKSPATKIRLLDSFGMEWDILWRSSPPFIISLFALCRNGLVDKAVYHITRADIEKNSNSAPSDRVESSEREEKASLLGKQSDKCSFNYLEKLTVMRGWYARKNRDFNLMTGLLLGLLATYILQPLMASLIKEQESVFIRNVITNRPLDFSSNILANLEPYQWNLILDSTMAEDLHTGEPTPWTNRTHAFRPLYPQTDFSDRGTLTAASTAYTAHLSCEQVPKVAFELDDLGVKDGFVRASLTAMDRNCTIAYAFTFSPTTRPLVSEAFHQTGCGLSNSMSRILLLVAAASGGKSTPAQLHNATLISCIAAYSATAGNLTVSWMNGTTPNPPHQQADAPAFISFDAKSPVSPTKTVIQETFEASLLRLREVQYGTTQDQVANTEFADFVMAVASTLPPLTHPPTASLSTSTTMTSSSVPTSSSSSSSSSIETTMAIIDGPEVLLTAVPLAFASIYRVAVAKAGMVPAAATTTAGDGVAAEVTGRLETIEMRLWVRYWLVAVTGVYLVLSAGSSVWLRRWWGWKIQVGGRNGPRCEVCMVSGGGEVAGEGGAAGDERDSSLQTGLDNSAGEDLGARVDGAAGVRADGGERSVRQVRPY